MNRRTPSRGRAIPFVILSFYCGAIAGWWLHATLSRGPAASPAAATAANDRPAVVATAGDVDRDRGATVTGSWVAELRRHHLILPIVGIDVDTLAGQFTERRGGGARDHEAVDILAPRHTEVHAVDDGKIAKLFVSKAGGTTIYQFDPTGRFCYYYAHLQRYAEGLHEGQHVSKGDVIGYVGTTGNAPANTPHLHFAIFELTAERQWWRGTSLDPYLVFKAD